MMTHQTAVSESPGHPSTTILVVEDDPILAKFWCRLLNETACNDFSVCQSADEALDEMQKKGVDLLITDLTLPGMDGIELIKQATAFNPRVRVIVTSAYVGDTVQFAGLHSFIHVLKKPYKNVDHVKELVSLFLQDAVEISGAEEETPEGIYMWDL